MRQGLALVALENNDIAGFCLLFVQLRAQVDPFDLAGRLSSFPRVAGPPPTELFSQRLGGVASG
jgi:hypothetical protein